MHTVATQFGTLPITLGMVQTTDPGVGGNDVINTGTGNSIVMGGTGADMISTVVGGARSTTRASSSATTA